MAQAPFEKECIESAGSHGNGQNRYVGQLLRSVGREMEAMTGHDALKALDAAIDDRNPDYRVTYATLRHDLRSALAQSGPQTDDQTCVHGVHVRTYCEQCGEWSTGFKPAPQEAGGEPDWEAFGKEAIRLARGNITCCGTCNAVRDAYAAALPAPPVGDV